MSKEIINIGSQVICDSCNNDYTRSKLSGGFSFSGYAYCPKCAPRMLETIKKHEEEEFIDSKCPEGKSFADYVREDLRGNNPGTIEIITGKELNKFFN